MSALMLGIHYEEGRKDTMDLSKFYEMYSNIGIKHGFSCINIRHVPWEVLKTEAEGRGF